jgi:hypothetical protein
MNSSRRSPSSKTSTAVEAPGAEQVFDAGEAHDVAAEVLCCAVFSR